MKILTYILILLSFLVSPTISLVFAQESVKSNPVITRVGDAPLDQKPQVSNSLQLGVRATAPDIPDAALEGAIKEKFGITMRNYGTRHLRWAWEKFWDVSHTKFFDYVRGSTIFASVPRDSSQVGCFKGVSVYVGTYQDETLFKLILIHELGHVIANCNNREQIRWSDYLRAHAVEKGVTWYGNHAYECTKSNNISEDFAETIAYYLNPETKLQTVLCSPDYHPPNLREDFPLHYNVANYILGNY
ncbi:hypothetical protein HYS91_01735 [Candidatus Daviesbacteria bacterium]|nr:hypothetical protein [Candidatus Daviesbacteria bacterium]